MANQYVKEMKKSMCLPVIVAPMFLISNPSMVIESCKEGVIGTFPALNARTGNDFESWMVEIKEALREHKETSAEKLAPWGVNLIVHRSNKRYEEDLKLIKKHEPPIIITSLGDPSPVVEIVHEYGGLVLSDVINPYFAKKAIEKGSDGLVLVANGAGGHGGTLNPAAFINEVKKFFNGPIVLAGALSKGEDILAAEVMGADFAYLGSRFIATEESSAEQDYKDMVIDSNIDDIMYTDAFTGVKGNYLIPSIQRSGLNPLELEKPDKVSFNEMNQTDAKVWKDIWGAGQGVGTITKMQALKEIVQELYEGYTKAVNIVVDKKNDFR